jgi:hypothetical protein
MAATTLITALGMCSIVSTQQAQGRPVTPEVTDNSMVQGCQQLHTGKKWPAGQQFIDSMKVSTTHGGLRIRYVMKDVVSWGLGGKYHGFDFVNRAGADGGSGVLT